MDNYTVENQMSIDDFLGNLIKNAPKKRTPKPATSAITAHTRRESNENTKKQPQRLLVIDTLRGKELTAREIAEKMHAAGLLPYPARAVIQPRITELVESGDIEATGEKLDCMTKRTVAVYKVV